MVSRGARTQTRFHLVAVAWPRFNRDILYPLGARVVVEGVDKVGLFEWLRNALTAVGLKPLYLPWIGAVPAPTRSAPGMAKPSTIPVTGRAGTSVCFASCPASGAAMIIGIPLGLLLAVSRSAYAHRLPGIRECCGRFHRSQWVPASIIFWPTQELSIAFVTFLGAFYTSSSM